MPVVREKDAVSHGREGVQGTYYQFPDISGGTTVAFAEFTGPHGERTIGERPRIYAVLEGNGEFIINGEKVLVTKGDVVAISPHATYNLFPKDGVVKIVLFMELLDVSKLPK
ncbi:MAG TPA: hypothetical protein VJB96_01430 [Patescibacteria group bacterium]|nr:hypothetical protein [Patescibacteria group bacterium]